jgi:lipopolysaccharide/colanic/teichoic acid biosynthesis glycosyltransferase
LLTLPLQVAVMAWGWYRHGSPYQLEHFIGENGSRLSMPKLHGAKVDALHLGRLPALLLVITGQMSLIGPSPVRPGWLEDGDSLQETLYAMKPGFIGPWWLVQNGRPTKADDEIAVDLRYARGYTIWMDFKVLWEVAMSLLVVSQPEAAASSARVVDDLAGPDARS